MEKRFNISSSLYRDASSLLQQCMTLLGQEELFQSSADVLLEAMQQPSYGKYLSFRDALLQCFTSDGMRTKFAECITGTRTQIHQQVPCVDRIYR